MTTIQYPLTVEFTPVLIRSSWNFNEDKLFKVGKTIIEGKDIVVFFDGSRTEENYKNCKLHGSSTSWYYNGQKEYEWNFVEGEEEGTSVGWYKDGQKRYEIIYKNDIKDGLATWWDSDGEKEGEEYYEDGELIREEYYEDGELIDK